MNQETLGFPLWLRTNHFINLLCIFLLMRSGMQILSDHPKLYWNDHAMPGSEWIKFGKKAMPRDHLWTSMDEAEYINPVVALPGGRHNLGAGRNWHFLVVPLWILNGVAAADSDKLDDYPPRLGQCADLCPFSDSSGQHLSALRSVATTHICGDRLAGVAVDDSDVETYATVGQGQGGYREDAQFFDKVAAI
jgi:hypothetical protein